MRLVLIFVATSIFTLPVFAQPLNIEGRVAQYYDAFFQLGRDASADDDWDTRDAELKRAYRAALPREFILEAANASGAEELRALFYSIYSYAVTLDRADWRPAAVDLNIVFESMVDKGWADEDILRDMHKFYISFRLFPEAEAFKRRFKDAKLESPLPIRGEVPSKSGRLVLTLSDAGDAFLKELIDIENAVVIVGHPRCKFSNNAVTAIAGDAQLASGMAASAIWIVDATTSLTDGAIVKWNAEHPASLDFHVPWSSRDWPEINYWGTPAFYFFREGKLVKKVVGWPKESVEEQKIKLKDGLRLIGSKATP